MSPPEPTPPPWQVSVQGHSGAAIVLHIKEPCRPGCLSSHHTHSATSYTEVGLKLAYKRLLRSKGEKRESSQTLPIPLPTFLPFLLSL